MMGPPGGPARRRDRGRIGSFFAGTVGTFLVALAAPPHRAALAKSRSGSAAEYFSLM